MKFKRDWPIIFWDYCLTFTLLFLLLFFTIFLPYLKSGEYANFFDAFLLYAAFALEGFLGYYCIGVFTNTIILDDEGITFLERKQPAQKIRWNEIKRIYRTRYKGGKALIFWDIYGTEIYFYYNKKIEKYIRSHHPEIEPMLPDEKDKRKWQQWDKKLRF